MSLKLLEMIDIGNQDLLDDIGLGAVVGRMFTPLSSTRSHAWLV
jgi:hypothetical protein